MAQFPVFVYVDFTDASARVSTIRYRLQAVYDDVAANFASVQVEAAALIDTLNLLTWDQITGSRVCVEFGATGAAPNVAANNQIAAFLRFTDSNGDEVGVDVPAWDDLTYSKDKNNLLSAAFITAATGLTSNIVNPDTGADLVTLNFAQSRTRKSRVSIT